MVKVTLVQALSSVQAVWTIGGVAVQLYPFMITTLEGDEGSASRPGRSLPPGKTRYPLYRRLGGPQVRSGQVRKISPPPSGIRSPDRPARSQSLYRLRYPVHLCDYDHYFYSNQDLNSHAVHAIKWPVDVSCISESPCTPSAKFGRDYK